MKYVHYSKYAEEDLGIGAEELLQALSDFLLESGFNTQYSPFSQRNEHTLEDLKLAILQALEQGRLFDNDRLQEMMERLQAMTPEQMDKLLDNLVQTKGRSPSKSRASRKRRRPAWAAAETPR